MKQLRTWMFSVWVSSFVLFGFFTSQAHGWEKNLPKAAKGFLRAHIHVHSVYSHDACDKKPQKSSETNGSNGVIVNEKCLKTFRQALCKNHIDVVFLTEHKKHMAFFPIEQTLNVKENDVPLFENGKLVGSRQKCADGHEVTLFMGAENDLMPIGMTEHPETVNGSQVDGYSGQSAEDVERLKKTGALVAIPHVEDWEAKQILDVSPDLYELYNPHEDLKSLYADKKPFKIIARALGLLPFIYSPNVEPDTIFLGFYSLNPKVFANWGKILSQRLIPAIVGSDVHQNSIFIKATDGERVDGYRRSMRWFSNYIEEVPKDRVNLLGALKNAHSYVVFEIFGRPDSLKFEWQQGNASSRMGSEVSLSGLNGEGFLYLKRPSIFGFGNKALATPITLKILKATGNGFDVVAIEDNADLTYRPTEAGTYIGRVDIKPRHLKNAVGKRKKIYNSEHPWIFTNPIVVTD